MGAEIGVMGMVRIGSKQEVGRRKRGIFIDGKHKGVILHSVPVLLYEGFSDLLLSGFGGSVLRCFFCFVLPTLRERLRCVFIRRILLFQMPLKRDNAKKRSISLDEVVPACSTNYLSPRLPKLSCLDNHLLYHQGIQQIKNICTTRVGLCRGGEFVDHGF